MLHITGMGVTFYFFYSKSSGKRNILTRPRLRFGTIFDIYSRFFRSILSTRLRFLSDNDYDFTKGIRLRYDNITVSNEAYILKRNIMTRLNCVEKAQYELDQLSFWFKLNKGQQGTDEWNNNIERGIDLSETVNNL